MAFQSGTVTGFAGATGLLQALLDFVNGTEVTGEALSGAGTSYSGTLAHSPVGLGRMVVTYIIGGVTYAATDDGSGAFAGTGISSGSITYATGAYAFTFGSAPDSAPTVAYIYGAAGQDWRQEVNRNTRSSYNGAVYDEPFGSDCKEVILSNKGLSGAENVIIGIREWKYVAGSAWGWDLNPYTYLPEGDFDWNFHYTQTGRNEYDGTWEHFSEKPTMPMHDNTMYYWFYSNQQRIIVVAKVSSNYESCYMGFGRRFGTPTDYPYPCIVSGSGYGNVKYTDTGKSHSYCIDAYHTSGAYHTWVIDPSNEFLFFYSTTNLGVDLYPRHNFASAGQLYPDNLGRFIMTPVYAVPYNVGNPNTTLFDLDGIYHTMGFGLQSEDTIKYNGRVHRVFQNIHRTDYFEYMAVDEAATTTTTTTTSSTTTTTTV
jgi:hypothetical protein